MYIIEKICDFNEFLLMVLEIQYASCLVVSHNVLTLFLQTSG